MENRRNYYRILHVQPDSPLAVIKSSYRTLMHKLKMHPDLGGEHYDAVLINEAYQVLTDPVKRAQYDEVYLKYLRANNANTQVHTSSDASISQKSIQTRRHELKPCFFCGGKAQQESDQFIWCQNCGSPLQEDSIGLKFSNALGSDVRRNARVKKSNWVDIYTFWPQEATRARILDLSPTGLRLETDIVLEPKQIIKIDSGLLKALAKVEHVSTKLMVHQTVGLSFLTVKFIKREGNFYRKQI